MNDAPSIHASCVLVGARAVLIRGPSGAGKSRLAWRLIQAERRGDVAFARLVSDDRTLVSAAHGRLVARPAAPLAGMIELRGIGIRHVPYEPMAVVGLVVDLAAASDRMPGSDVATVAGVELPRLAVAPDRDPFPLVLAAVAGAA